MSEPPHILINWVSLVERGVAATVTTGHGHTHRLGHLPKDGWFCTCPRGKRCTQIAHVKPLVPDMENK